MADTAARSEIERLNRLLDWCWPRLKKQHCKMLVGYRENPPKPDHTILVQSMANKTPAEIERDILDAIGSGDAGIRDAALLAAHDAIADWNRRTSDGWRTARAEALEEAAKVCDGFVAQAQKGLKEMVAQAGDTDSLEYLQCLPSMAGLRDGAGDCAKAIRALKEKK